MITTASFTDFKAVGHLGSTVLAQNHGGRFRFSAQRPTVLIGPNGAGKSALMQALALRFLAWFTSESALDDHYVFEHGCEHLWSEERGWPPRWTFLPGMTCETDNAPALFYRPNHVPGNETSVVEALMMGYSMEARAHAALVERKSSGQQSQALLAHILDVLAGGAGPTAYLYKNWRFGRQARAMEARGALGDWDDKAEALRATYGKIAGGVPLILLDEPELSLDARAELQLWSRIAAADPAHVQVVAATHSLYPLLHRDKFELIEAVPGYIDEVTALMR